MTLRDSGKRFAKSPGVKNVKLFEGVSLSFWHLARCFLNPRIVHGKSKIRLSNNSIITFWYDWQVIFGYSAAKSKNIVRAFCQTVLSSSFFWGYEAASTLVYIGRSTPCWWTISQELSCLLDIISPCVEVHLLRRIYKAQFAFFCLQGQPDLFCKQDMSA